MGQSYMKLYVTGGTLTEAEYEDIPYPTLELTDHVSAKCVESGCILGTISGTVKTLVKSESRNVAGFVSNVTRHGFRLAVIGLCISPLMVYGKIKNLEDSAIFDRVYRIRHNKGQVRVDKAATLGLIGGPIAAKVLGQPLLFGVVTGVAGSVTGMAFYNNAGIKK